MEIIKKTDYQLSPILNSIKKAIKDDKLLYDSSNLTNVLQKIFVMLGLNSDTIPKQKEFNFIKNLIIDTYPGLTANEILIAFKFAIQGKLNVDIELYNQPFSFKYLCNIINAYKSFRFDYIRQIKQNESSDSLNKSEAIEYMDKAVIRDFELYSKGENIIGYAPAHFRHLKNDKKVLNLTESQWQMNIELAKEYRQSELNNKKRSLKNEERKIAKTLLSQYVDCNLSTSEENHIELKAMEYALFNFFDELIENNKNLKELLT